MPRKPKENYFQVSGRPHQGLENPELFGLTRDQVIDLIMEDRWRNFYFRWRRKQKRNKEIEALDFVCPSCNERKPNLRDWQDYKVACRECDPRKRDNKDLGRCWICNEVKPIFEEVAGVLYCKSCLTLYGEVRKSG